MFLKNLLSLVFVIFGLLSAVAGKTVMEYARPEGLLPLACGFAFFLVASIFFYKSHKGQGRAIIILTLSLIFAHASLMSTGFLHITSPTTEPIIMVLNLLLYYSLFLWLAFKLNLKSLIGMAVYQVANLLLEIMVANSAAVGTHEARISALHIYLTANILFALAIWFVEILHQRWQSKKAALNPQSSDAPGGAA